MFTDYKVLGATIKKSETIKHKVPMGKVKIKDQIDAVKKNSPLRMNQQEMLKNSSKIKQNKNFKIIIK